MEININKQGQLIIENFKEIENNEAYIKKENENEEKEFNAYDFYEY